MNTWATASILRNVSVILSIGVASWAAVPGAPPELYSQPFLQSPVRAEPTDLLMIPGRGFDPDAQVVYRRLTDTTLPLVAPASVPPTSTAVEGVLAVASCTADRLVVRLPAVMSIDQSYGIWARNSDGSWSEGIRINDARPLWITPNIAHETSPVATLPRELKVVGRNLQPAPTAPAGKTRVRLTGPQTFTLDGLGELNPALEHYVTRVALPETMTAGDYTVELSRDGISWVTVADSIDPAQSAVLTVRPDPSLGQIFPVTGFGCSSDDNLDDAPCIQSAITAAETAGGGVVQLGVGRWDLMNVPDPSGSGGIAHGIIVPRGVSLIGAGRDSTRVVRTDQWGFVPGDCPHPTQPGQTLTSSVPCVRAVFTLLGDNTITGIHFDSEFPHALEFPFLDDLCAQACGPDDACVAGCRLYEARFFQLGKLPWWTDSQTEPTLIEDVVFTANRITEINLGILDGGWPLRHIFISGNEMEAYRDDIILGGNSFRRSIEFQVDDSVIAFNDFYPGGYYDPDVVQGVIISQIGAGRRFDLSSNVAHAANLANDCAAEPGGCGWRAGHFWHMNNNHEGVLVSRNVLACTGDKAGDGEAIVFDNNQNKPGFKSARHVLGASSDSVVVQGPWHQEGSAAGGDLNYYGQHWVQVTEGPGIGQGRKIESCCCGTLCTSPSESACGAACSQPISIRVSPEWDVAPVAGSSKVEVLRVMWQNYIVDNQVDIRGCEKDNPTAPRSGVINFHGNTTDSAIEGNTQWESDGVRMNSGYSVESYDPETGSTFTSWGNHKFFTEIRDNEIQGEYNFNDCAPPGCPVICCRGNCCPPDGTDCIVDDYCTDSDCCSEQTCCVPKNSWSGIDMLYGQYRVSDSPVLSYGVSISHNTVNNADGLRGGAITVDRGWWDPPTAGHNQWTSVLVHHNVIDDLRREDSQGDCLPYSYYGLDGGIGVHLGESHTHDSVLYDNQITNVCYELEDFGTDTLVLEDCPPETECSDGAGCVATSTCFTADTGVRACLKPDESVFKCPPFHSVNVRRCNCSGPVCPLNDNHLVCVPDPGLPDCPQESECDGTNCSATNQCFIVDAGGFEACIRDDQTVFDCPTGETVHVERCFCSGDICPLSDNHLVCAPDPQPAPSAPGALAFNNLKLGRSTLANGHLALTWTGSCATGAEDYGIHEGAIGDWYSHTAIDCTDLDGDLSEEITPASGDRYYLVVPNNVDDDGSYGKGPGDLERPPGQPACRTTQDLSGCS